MKFNTSQGGHLKFKEQNASKDNLQLIFGCGALSSQALDAKLSFPNWSEISTYAPVTYTPFDPICHGESDIIENRDRCSWQTQSHDYDDLIKHFNKPCILGGISMTTGAILHYLTNIYPISDLQNLIKGAILVIPPTCYDTRALMTEQYKKLANIAKSGMPEIVNIIKQAPRTEFSTKYNPGAAEQYFNHLASIPKEAYISIMLGASVSDFPSRELIEKISIPVLILGRTLDNSHPVKSFELLAQAIPNSQLSIAQNREDVLAWPRVAGEWIKQSTRRTPI